MTCHLLATAPVPLSYWEWGSGPPVLMLHGLADHGLVWQSLAASLGSQYRCLAPDLRGHGDSGKPEDPTAYDSLAFVADLAALAQAVLTEPVTVIAHSWAAKLALLWAKQSPQGVKQLILVDPFFVNTLPPLFRPTLPLFYRTLPFLKVMGPFPHRAAAIALAQTLKQYRGWSPLQAAVFEATLEQKPDGTWGSKFAVAARNGVFEDILSRDGLTEPLAVPTHLILPQAGLNRMAWQTRPYYRYLTDLHVHSVPGNHWPHLVEPEAFNAALAAILSPAA
ncbi:MAG: alpha/beta hydrolase [Leptolyngbya sp.]|nr:alpha/beta hydrolase [Leptolyngbya sp.]